MEKSEKDKQDEPLKNKSSADKISSEESDGPVKPTEYSPDKNYYHPIKNACWKYGEK